MNQPDVVATPAAAAGAAILCSDGRPLRIQASYTESTTKSIPESLADLQTLGVWRNGSSLYTRARPSTKMYHLNYLTHRQHHHVAVHPITNFINPHFIYLDFLNDPLIKHSIYYLLGRSWLLQVSSFLDMLSS